MKGKITTDERTNNPAFSNREKIRKFEKEMHWTVDETAEALAHKFGITKKDAKEILFELIGI